MEEYNIEEQGIDYIRLLHKYIEHVGQEEGVTYINKLTRSYKYSDVEFTKNEIKVLQYLDSLEYKNKTK